MSALPPIPRRGFLGLALGVSGGMIAGSTPAMAAFGERPVLVYDPAIAAARSFAEGARADYAALHVIEGDRIRFARTMLKSRPRTLSGLTRYADFILLSGAAAEARYRLIAQSQHRAGPGGALIAWTMRRV